ncbi:MAG: YccF domain-containing protein [Prevotellaceae bacterium]|jgi:uncharacterized membrane protein YccF (DUF307 family)|nr:YccF domain-containing protein [Prevotellaceae bacterium]
MRTLGNIIWHIPLCGFLCALFVFLFGALLVLTVVASPIGLGLIQLSKFLLAPYSHSMVSKNDMKVAQNPAWETYGYIVRIIYFPFGLFIAMIIIMYIVILTISIIGIPIAIVLAKSLGTYFNPVNKVCVPKAVKDEMQRRKAQEYLDRKIAK